MPHLQFEINKKINPKVKKSFIKYVQKSFSSIMQTGTDHIAISIREFEKNNLSLGRANSENSICLMNLDIRSGRTKKQIKQLVKTLIIGSQKLLGIPKNNQYITITNHSGDQFNFFEKSLSDWVKHDDPAKN